MYSKQVGTSQTRKTSPILTSIEVIHMNSAELSTIVDKQPQTNCARDQIEREWCATLEAINVCATDALNVKTPPIAIIARPHKDKPVEVIYELHVVVGACRFKAPSSTPSTQVDGYCAQA